MSEAAQTPEPSQAGASKSMDEIMALCKRRGFVFQASEIYGGINGFWDYGPLGAQLKKNLRDAWWEDMIMIPCGGKRGPSGNCVRTVPIETRIIQHPKVWEASGHISGFNDPMVDDKETKQRFRADQLLGFYQEPQATKSLSSEQKEAIRSALLSSRLAPIATIVASSARDALDVLAEHKGALRAAGIRQVDVIEPFVDFVMLETRTGKGFAALKPVPMDDLRSHAASIPSPFTGKPGQLTEPRQFNLMFISYTGAVFSEDNKVYLRPETAQGVFVQFKNVVDTTRVKVPFGIGSIGTSFRNEVTPRNYTFRSREFEQMELEFFCHPSESTDWYAFWRDYRMQWWRDLGLAGDNLQLREHAKDELSHYSSGTSDIEYRFPFTAPGFGELEGVAHRGDYDLRQHQQHSGVKLDYFDTDRGELLANGSKKGERYLPHCIEPAAGLDRGVLAILCEAYTKDASRPSPEIMRFHPRIAPIKAAVFPLVNKDGMPEVADRLHAELQGRFGRQGFIETDAKQSIGKRYARMDEAGCPYCFTIDGQTLQDKTVTVRDRDSGKQDRIALDKVSVFLAEKLGQ